MPRWCCDVVPLIRKWGESGMQLSWRHLSLPLLPLMRWWSGLMMTVALPANFTFWKLDFSQMKHYIVYVHICKSSRLAMGMVNNKPGRSPRFNYCAGGGGGSGQNLLYGDWSGGRWAQWLPYSPIMPSDETVSGLRPTNKNDKCHEIYSSQHWIKNSHSTHKVFSFKADE